MLTAVSDSRIAAEVETHIVAEGGGPGVISGHYRLIPNKGAAAGGMRG